MRARLGKSNVPTAEIKRAVRILGTISDDHVGRPGGTVEEPSRVVMASPAASTAVSSRTPSGDYLTRAARAEKQIRELLLDSNFHFSNAPGVSMSASEVGGRGVRTERPCVPPAAGANYFTMYTQFTSILTRPATYLTIYIHTDATTYFTRFTLHVYTDATRPYIHILPDTTRDLLYDLQCTPRLTLRNSHPYITTPM